MTALLVSVFPAASVSWAVSVLIAYCLFDHTDEFQLRVFKGDRYILPKEGKKYLFGMRRSCGDRLPVQFSTHQVCFM